MTCFSVLTRTRERAIREKIKVLIDILPYQVCKATRPSRVTILDKAAEYIITMEEDINILQQKLDVKSYQSSTSDAKLFATSGGGEEAFPFFSRDLGQHIADKLGMSFYSVGVVLGKRLEIVTVTDNPKKV